jgi:hypothetical protein
MVNAARDEVSGRHSPARSLALARDIVSSKEIPARIGQVFTPENASNIARTANAEVVFDATKRGVTGGPDTASKIADMFDNAGVRITGGGTPSLKWWDTFKDIAGRLTGPNEAVRDKIGRIALNPDASENRRLLAEILASIDKRNSGRSLSAALAGSSGAQFGGP